MASATDIIQDSLEKLGVFAPGETPDDASLQRGLVVLNDMIDSWSNESLSCFALLEQSVELVPGKNQYTIGPGVQLTDDFGNPLTDDFGNPLIVDGSVDIPGRPIRVITGPGAAYLLDTNNNRYPVDVYPRDKWNMIWNLKMPTSNLPNIMFFDPQFPTGTINVFPMPNVGNITLYFDSFEQLLEFNDLTTDVQFPPGYIKAFKDNLAVELAPYFKPDNYQISNVIVAAALASKANIKRANQRQNFALYDREMSGNAGRPYNIYSDTYR